MLVGFVPLLGSPVLVLLRDTVKKLVASVTELVHEAILLRLRLLWVGGYRVVADSLLRFLGVPTAFLLRVKVSDMRIYSDKSGLHTWA